VVAARTGKQGAYVSVRPLDTEDAAPLSRLLTADPPEYARYFHPFPFTVEAILDRIARARLDCHFAIELRNRGI